ncbi:MFS transporter [Roseomonas sp. BN140053]|uniref:MFS transporter n=1 Tax=Roseomonas sp. BN140053 TaxID=3391898 RepID=UPI0039E9A660
MSDTRVDAVEAEIDRRGVHGLQIRVAVLCAIVLALDGFDIAAMGFALPSLAESWKIAPSTLTGALVAANVGMLIGALASGPLGDRFGRKPVFMVDVAVFGIFSLLSAACHTVELLTAARFLTGLGLGGGVPLAIALTSDYSPKKHQPKLVAIMTVGVQCGMVGGGLLVAELLPIYGWQSVFVVGGVLPLAILPLLYFLLPESLQFMTAQGRSSRLTDGMMGRNNAARQSGGEVLLRKNPVAELFRNGLTPVTLLLWVMFACNFLSTYLITLWLPTILRSYGYGLGEAVFATTLFSLAGGLCALVLGWPIARWGSERVIAINLCIGVAAVLWLAVGGQQSHAMTLLSIFMAGIGISGSQAGMNALSGAAYPSLIRSSGSGWALGIGRLGNIFGPLLGGLLLGYGYPPTAIFLCGAVPVAIAAAAMLSLGLLRGNPVPDQTLAAPRLH